MSGGEKKIGLLIETSPLTSVSQSHQVFVQQRDTWHSFLVLLGGSAEQRLCSSWSTWRVRPSYTAQKALHTGRLFTPLSTAQATTVLLWRQELSLWRQELSLCLAPSTEGAAYTVTPSSLCSCSSFFLPITSLPPQHSQSQGIYSHSLPKTFA